MSSLQSGQAGARDVAMSVMAGLVVGIMGVVSLTSYSALIFSGQLVPYLAEGIGIALLAGTVIALVIALSSSYRGAVALPQDIPAAVFSVVAAEMALAASFTASQSQLFPTLVTTLMLTSLVMGVLFLALGTCKLGGLIHPIRSSEDSWRRPGGC
jgi:SulP family sulfate permease